MQIYKWFYPLVGPSVDPLVGLLVGWLVSRSVDPSIMRFSKKREYKQHEYKKIQLL